MIGKEKQIKEAIYEATDLELAMYGISFLHTISEKTEEELSWLATALCFQDEEDIESLQKGLNKLKGIFPLEEVQ